MKFRYKFQEGGPMPAESGAPAPQEAGQDPMAQLVQGAAEAVQTGNCDVAMQVCQMLVELAGGGAQEAPQEAAPVPAEGEPVFFRNGGTFKMRRI